MNRVGRRLAVAAIVGAGVLGFATVVTAAGWKVQSTDKLADLRAAADGTEGATAHVKAEPVGDSATKVHLKVTGLDHLQEGRRYGAHVHTGQCKPGDGAAAGPHYNVTGGSTISGHTEVWLDFVAGKSGIGESDTVVPFRIPPGAAMSVVVHELPTNPATGTAGARVACLPVDF